MFLLRPILLFAATAIVATSGEDSQAESPLETEDASTVDELGKGAAEIVRRRGFVAEDYHVTTRDGYILSLVRCNNPKIHGPELGGLANKSVVLMVHGILSNAQGWVMNSVGAKPQNYAHLSANNMSPEELTKLLAKDPSSNSLAITLLNFGHEVWLLNRRGTLESQGHTSKRKQPFRPLTDLGQTLVGGSPLVRSSPERRRRKRQVNSEIIRDPALPLRALLSVKLSVQQVRDSVNPRYWNYSLDHQAHYDLPKVVEFILEKTRRKRISLVAHSAGGALTLMALSEGLLRHKLIKKVLWAPAMNLGHATTSLLIASTPLIEAALINYLGPFLPSFLVPIVQAAGGTICATWPTERLLCDQVIVHVLAGKSGGQQKLAPGFWVGFGDVISSQEFVQIAQSAIKKRMHRFDFRSEAKNMAAYGQVKPPAYNVSLIDEPGISVWYGDTDSLVTPADTRDLLRQMTVPVEHHLIGSLSSHVYFNHFSFFIHRNISRLLVLPTLAELEAGDLEQELDDELSF